MGDTCCYPFSMGRIKRLIEEQLPGIYVYSVMVGDSVEEDERAGFIGNVNDQLKEVYDKINSDSKLLGGFNAIGFSQGGQFLRGYVEHYNNPPVQNLISVGGQHQGVFGFPACDPETFEFCETLRELLDLAYVPGIQNVSVQAQYWQDPTKQELYTNASIFLADINNQKEEKNQVYKQNLQSLKTFVLVLFENDTVVIPRESEWFGYYTPGQDIELQTLQQSQLYQEDWLGLKSMDEKGQLAFLSTEGDHLDFSDDWFIENIIPYLE
eukprot:TRINITY_DN351_c0_g1_i2.p1 TRINITY_DN351_c0_g1~~TRINITY_DN351_c0_g1_i2.p1  ORF type:complete len:307 (-),score=82.82 TRINITY_DN351_c0_g1_i2:36-836(-)